MQSGSSGKDGEKTIRIMLVDDNPAVRNAVYGEVERYLQELGLEYELSVANDGTEALANIERAEGAGELPNLMIADVSMYPMSGPAMAQNIEAKYKGKRPFKLLFLTSHAPDVIQPLLDNELADGYIGKPLRIEVLREKIAEALGLKP